MINWTAFALAYLLTGITGWWLVMPLMVVFYCRKWRREFGISKEMYDDWVQNRSRKTNAEYDKNFKGQQNTGHLISSVLMVVLFWPYIMPKYGTRALEERYQELLNLAKEKNDVTVSK